MLIIEDTVPDQDIRKRPESVAEPQERRQQTTMATGIAEAVTARPNGTTAAAAEHQEHPAHTEATVALHAAVCDAAKRRSPPVLFLQAVPQKSLKYTQASPSVPRWG